MNGKLFLLAVVCVSFVQVWGDDNLENAINAGVSRVKTGAKDFQRRFVHIRKGIEFTHKKVNKDVFDFRTWLGIAETSDNRDIGWWSRHLKEKTNGREDMNMCIDEAQAKGSSKIGHYKKIYYDRGVGKMWPVFAFMSDTDNQYKKKNEEIAKAHEEVIKTIKACIDVTCVEKAVKNYNRQAWNYEGTIASLITSYVHGTTTLGNQLETYGSTGKGEMRESKKEAIAAMKDCLKQ